MKSPRDLANRMRDRRDDGYRRETFTLPVDAAREGTRDTRPFPGRRLRND